MLPKLAAFIAILFFARSAAAQPLKPVFDTGEYLSVLRMAAAQVDANYRGGMPAETGYTWVYRSPILGMHNRWDLWVRKDRQVMVVVLRGTTTDADSWLENFYSGMLPASGTLILDSGKASHYKFAADARARVHAGWSIGACSLTPDVERKLKEYYGRGTKQVIISGHSQGGALSFLVRSQLHYHQQTGDLPADMVFKTYCSAAPKPGNMYYAYDFDALTRGGWAYNVVNSYDWVPETPFTVQTMNEIHHANPFANADMFLKAQKWYVRMFARHMRHRMIKTTGKAQRTFERYLGRLAARQVKQYIPGFEPPKLLHAANYMRAGIPIVLQPDSVYFSRFPDTGSNVFRHHLFYPYYFLVKGNFK